MKLPRGLATIVFTLLGLLAIASALLALGQREVQSFPSTSSVAPSGTSIFAELLRRQGYRVVVDRKDQPDLRPGDLVIAPTVGRNPLFEVKGEEAPVEEVPRSWDRLKSFAQAGGQVIVLPFARNFQIASREAMRAGPRTVTRDSDGLKLQVSLLADLSETSANNTPFTIGDEGLNLWTLSDDQPYVTATSVGRGRALLLADGLGASNRFIAQADNARALTAIVASLAKPGSRIVITEATFGNVQNPGLMQTLGVWATVAWAQFLFLALVVAITLGKRFGQPERERRAQRGTRELVDAISDTYRRGHMAPVALRAAIDSADARLRSAYRIPRDASEGELDRILPEGVRQSIREAKIAVDDPKLTSHRAMDLARRLADRVDETLIERNSATAV